MADDTIDQERAKRLNQLERAIRAGSATLTEIERASAAAWGVPRADVRVLIDEVVEDLPDDVQIKGEKKKKSGAEFARARKAAEIERHLAALKKLGYVMPIDGSGGPDDDGIKTFTAALAAVEHDPADPTTALRRARAVQDAGMELAATRPLTDALLKRLKIVGDYAEALGTTQNRVELEERVVAVESLLANVKPHGAVQTTETNGHARPATARGGSASRRLRTVPGHAPGSRGVHGAGQPPEDSDGRDDPDGRGPLG